MLLTRRTFAFSILLFCGAVAGLPAQQTLPPMEVVGRAPSNLALEEGPWVTVFAEGTLRPANTPSLDRALAQVPGFSLFRRTGSLSSHPTTQGVSLRNLGPNGAGRSLVLLDGVPQNDPFGGWVNWTSMRGLALEQAAVLTGSSAGLYGSQALTGTVRLTTGGGAAGGWVDVNGGRFGLVEGLFASRMALGSGALQLSGGGSTTDGFFQVPASQRGPIDRRMALDTWRLRGTYETPINDFVSLRAGGMGFREDRGNGTPQAWNETEGLDFFLSLRSAEGANGPVWEALLYRQQRDFRNQFASVSDDRTSDRAVLLQFDTPGLGWGGSAFLRVGDPDTGAWTLGGDARWMDGETNERNRNLGNGFTRQRRAGGEQTVAGLFAQWSRVFGDATQVEAGARLDRWEVAEGLRIEHNLENDTIIRDDRFDDRSGEVFTGRVDLRHRFSDSIEGFAAAYRGFRLPTLNEYYRPFRVGNDITEANAELAPETLVGAEAGVLARLVGARATLRASLYTNRLEDGVTNVTLIEVDTGTFDPRFGFIPGGGSGRQRQNVDRIDAWGGELEWNQLLGENVEWTLRYLYSRSEFAGAAGNLAGNRPAQSPLHTLWTGLRWQVAERWAVRPDLLWVGEAFEDDLNRRELDGFLRLNATVTYQFRPHWMFYFRGDNLTNEDIQTRVSGDGLISVDAPFRWTFGSRVSF